MSSLEKRTYLKEKIASTVIGVYVNMIFNFISISYCNFDRIRGRIALCNAQMEGWCCAMVYYR